MHTGQANLPPFAFVRSEPLSLQFSPQSCGSGVITLWPQGSRTWNNAPWTQGSATCGPLYMDNFSFVSNEVTLFLAVGSDACSEKLSELTSPLVNGLAVLFSVSGGDIAVGIIGRKRRSRTFGVPGEDNFVFERFSCRRPLLAFDVTSMLRGIEPTEPS